MNGQGFYSSLESDLKLKSMASAVHIKTSLLVLSRLMIILSTDNSVRAWPSANWMAFDFMTLLKSKHLKFDLLCLYNCHNLKKAYHPPKKTFKDIVSRPRWLVGETPVHAVESLKDSRFASFHFIIHYGYVVSLRVSSRLIRHFSWLLPIMS